MTDIADAAPAGDPTPAAEAPVSSGPAPAPVVATTTVAGSEPAGDPDPFDGDLPDDQVFSRGYVEKLRKQGQTYREQAQTHAEQLAEYEAVYGQYDPEDRQAWFAMAQEWAADPRSGAEMMQRIAEAVLNEGMTPEEATEQVIAEDQVAAEADASGVPMTKEQIKAIVDEELEAERAAAREKEAIDSVFNELRAAGFDPHTREGHSVLWTANNETGGDIAKAIEIVQGERQKIIDEFVAGKSAPQARTAPSDGMLATSVPKLDTLEEAGKAVNDFLKGMQTQPG